jgi:hypothetical protein
LSFLALSPRWDRLYPLAVRRTAVLLTASFRFHLAMDTLAVRLAVPTIRACSGLAPPSLRTGHHSQFARAYALRAMPGAPNKSATPHSGVALFAAPTSDIGHALYQAWAAFQPRRNSHPASAFRHGTRFVSVLHRRSRPTGNETVPHPSSAFCSMGGRPQRPTIGHRVFPPSILFLVRARLQSCRKLL